MDRQGSRTHKGVRPRWSFPRCADVVASRLQAVVGCALVVTLVVGNQLDLDVERQGAKCAGEAVFSAVKVPMLAMMISPFGLNKVAPVRPCCDPPGGDGLAAPRSGRNNVENRRRKEFVREECAQRRGNCFRRKVAVIKPKAQPRHRRFTTRQGRTGRPLPNGDMADSASSHDNFTGLFPDAASMPQQQGTSAPATTCGHMLDAWRGSSTSRPWCVGEPSFVTYWQRTASVEYGTLSCNLPQQAGA